MLQSALVFYWHLGSLLPLPHSFLYNNRTTPPCAAINAFVNCLAKKHANQRQPVAVTLSHSMCSSLMHDFWDYTSSALSENSSRPSLVASSAHPLFLWWPSHLERPCTFTQLAHFQGTVIINFNKVSQALRNTFSVSFTQAVTILCIGLSPSFCWFASNLSALIKCAFNTFA